MCWGANYFGGLGNGTTRDGLVPVDVDFAAQGPPLTDAANPGSHERPADFPLLLLLPGVAGGIAMLVRRRVGLAQRTGDVDKISKGSRP